MDVSFTPQFRRQFRKLVPALQEEALEKIALFKDHKHRKELRVHKLSGKLAGRFSFSVNYQYRIVFQWEVKEKSVILLTIGDHSVYD